MTSPNFQKSHCFFLLQATQIDCQPVKSFWITLKTLEFYEELHIRHFCHNINEITIGAGKRKVKTLSNECGVKSERLVAIYCFLLPSDVSTRVPISGCRFSYHSHFSRHSQTTIVPLATRGAIFSQKKHSTLYLKMTRVKILLLLLFLSPFLTKAAPSINPEER